MYIYIYIYICIYIYIYIFSIIVLFPNETVANFHLRICYVSGYIQGLYYIILTYYYAIHHSALFFVLLLPLLSVCIFLLSCCLHLFCHFPHNQNCFQFFCVKIKYNSGTFLCTHITFISWCFPFHIHPIKQEISNQSKDVVLSALSGDF